MKPIVPTLPRPGRRSRAAVRIRRGLQLAALGLCWALLTVPVRADGSLEYQVKAGFLFNFLKFTDWPPGFQPEAGKPYRVAVYGDRDVYETVAGALRGKRLHDSPIEVTAVGPDDDLSGYHLLFIPRRAGVPPAKLTGKLAGGAVLLVGEQEGFAAEGGVIGLVLRGDNVRFQVNLSAAEHAKLRLSGHLAALSEIVSPEHP
jgi:hypothetical protein